MSSEEEDAYGGGDAAEAPLCAYLDSESDDADGQLQARGFPAVQRRKRQWGHDDDDDSEEEAGGRRQDPREESWPSAPRPSHLGLDEEAEEHEEDEAEEEDEPEIWVTADIALARWLRRGGADAGGSARNPLTRLKVAAASRGGQAMLRAALQQLQQRLAAARESSRSRRRLARRNYVVATYHDRLGDPLAALSVIAAAMAADPHPDPDVAFLAAKLRRLEEYRARSTLHLVKAFFEEYASKGRPVVITGLLPEICASSWTLPHVREVAGAYQTTLKTRDRDSAEWAQLEDARAATVGDFIDGLGSGASTGAYLFDWSLPLFCPPLARELKIPKYFANDFLQRTAPGSMYRHSWPSLFIGAPSAGGSLHVDTFGSNFWMALFQGRKRWVFYSPEDVGLLSPQLYHSMDPVFELDPDHIDETKFPLARYARRCECVLEAGEVLYVPAGSPHCVSNLTTSVAVSGNYVDASNFALVKRELAIAAIKDPHAAALLAQFQRSDFDTAMRWDVLHTPVAVPDDV